ncbi:hypothetical protein ABIB62_003001 [Mucilaginibacter sp. UYP25]
MRYFVFILSIIFIISIVINVLGLDIESTFKRITNYGFGYITGNILLLVAFLFIAFLSGRAIVKKDLNGSD